MWELTTVLEEDDGFYLFIIFHNSSFTLLQIDLNIQMIGSIFSKLFIQFGGQGEKHKSVALGQM